MAKTSWRRLLTFSNYVNGFRSGDQIIPGWLMNHPEQSKFRYAVERIAKQVPKLNDLMQEKFGDIDIEHCAVDENGVILRDAKDDLRFTKDGLRARNAARKLLLDAADVEIEPHYATEIPELSDAEREIFTGLVIEEKKLEAVA